MAVRRGDDPVRPVRQPAGHRERRGPGGVPEHRDRQLPWRAYSQHLGFTGIETQTNTNQPLDQLTGDNKTIFDTYNPGGSIPFIDYGGKATANGASVDPSIFAGKTQAQIADDIASPTRRSPRRSSAARTSSAAQLCQLTNNQPDGARLHVVRGHGRASLSGERARTSPSAYRSPGAIPRWLAPLSLTWCVLGLLVAAYLTYEHYTGSTRWPVRRPAPSTARR